MIAAFSQAAADAMSAAVIAATGLSMSAAAALNLVDSFPGLNVGGLAKALNLSFAGTVRVVDELQRQGLVARQVGAEDRRSVTLGLTPPGKALAVRLAEARLEALAVFVAQLPDGSVAQLGDMADRMLRRTIVSDRAATHACRYCLLANCPPERCPLEHTTEP